jgi:hypothetical protein
MLVIGGSGLCVIRRRISENFSRQRQLNSALDARRIDVSALAPRYKNHYSNGIMMVILRFPGRPAWRCRIRFSRPYLINYVY